MLIQRILTALALGAVAVSALPGNVFEPEASDEFFDAEVDQEPLSGSQWTRIFNDFPGVSEWGPVAAPPPPPPGAPDWDASGKTIYKFLKDDEHFTRLFKLVNFTNEIINTLNDTSASLTLFAPPNSALKPPKRKTHRCSNAFVRVEDFEECFYNEHKDSDALETFAALEDLIDEKHDDHKKEILKRIVGAILSYHILPHSLSGEDLAKNTTFGTSYAPNDGAFDGKPLRIHVERQFRLLHPSLVINFYAKVWKSDIQASNGLVHVTNHPVLPPPAAFQELFLFSDHFSTFTSAIQRVGLTDAADWRYVPGEGNEKGTVEGSPSITVFAPINAAFKKLPWKLRLFLFSPFGEKVLGKLLAFHIVPDVIAHSDYFHNATDSVVGRDAQPECCMDADLNQMNLFGLHESTYMDLDAHLKDTPLSTFNALSGSSSERHDTLASIAKDMVHDVHGFIVNKWGVMRDKASGRVIGHGNNLHPSQCSCPKHSAVTPHHHHEPIYAHSGHLPTLLANHTLHVHVAQYEVRSPIPPHHSSYVKKFTAQGVPVKVHDVPARNGAVHVIDRLLDPRKGHGGHHHHHGGRRPDSGPQGQEENEWEGWEDWLIKWADEN
ncbi:hypothetical protein EIP91_011407 [Steccherinum ochraceum]|uniref:FAS1 domain-containing protein n=1 Tax=Steccherinum ochraceum TaxID=92696 RepID=A0A4R0QZQ6_9APHY|nr:hypothetical protein EIP91_011407 [Steccherinum ochraceum]